MDTTGTRRRRSPRLAAVGAGVLMLLGAGAMPAAANHEITIGETWYSDGTTFKSASHGQTVTLVATNVDGGGVYGGVYAGYEYQLVVGTHHREYDSHGNLVVDIPCYDNRHPFGGLRTPSRGYISDTPIVINTNDLSPGTWEVCFFSQPWDTVTTPVTLVVT